MIKVNCIRCGYELDLTGALLFSPPDDMDSVEKYHICRQCYYKVKEYLDRISYIDDGKSDVF